jgi:hypothetical protein
MTQGDWPAERLADDLRAINRLHLRDSADPALRGRSAGPNQMHTLFEEELADAQRLGVVPLGPGDPGFDELMRSGARFNWAVRLDGSLRVSPSIIMSEDGPSRISHAILIPGGGDALAVGEGRFGDFLSNTTGHYKNDVCVLEPVKRAFATIGIVFKR